MKNKFTKAQLIITGVIAFYYVGTIMMNVLTMKTLQIGSISVFTCGLFATPFVFACNDIITECTGEKFALRIVLIGAGLNLLWSLLCALSVLLPGNNEFIANAFSVILGSTWRIIGASIIAYILSGYINNFIMARLKDVDGEKHYYKRAILSSVAGQVLDDYVFMFLAFAPFGISAIENPWASIITVPIISAIAEVAIEAVFTPVSKKLCDVVKSEK